MLGRHASPVGAAGFPVLFSQALSAANAVSSTLTATLPARESGDLLVMLVFLIADTGSIDTPAGWSSMVQEASGGALTFRWAVFYRQTDGAEGSSVDISYTGGVSNRSMRASVLCVRGFQGTPEISSVTKVSDDEIAIPSLSPSWGLGATLWLTVATVRIDASAAYALSGYALTDNPGAGNAARLLHASERFRAASRSAGTLTSTISGVMNAATIAIRGR